MQQDNEAKTGEYEGSWDESAPAEVHWDEVTSDFAKWDLTSTVLLHPETNAQPLVKEAAGANDSEALD